MEESLHILGHEKIEAILARAIASGRIFSTWIFDGPFGVGKGAIARKFAKCFLADIVPPDLSLDIPTENPVHGLVQRRIHPDFFVLEQRDEAIPLDEVRELMVKVWKTPALSSRKVLILENASGLNKNIYNSLLKVLEEPPRNTIIILICNGVGTLPRTLLSRAAKITFAPLKTGLVQALLDNMGLERSRELARLSGGSVGMALHLHRSGGLEIYEHLLKAFDHDAATRQKHLRYLLDNKVSDNFFILRSILVGILKSYLDIFIGIADEKNPSLEKLVNEWPSPLNPSAEAEKILEIVSLLHKGDRLTLDKNALLVYAFDRFFYRSY
jgi:hypothetical protein